MSDNYLIEGDAAHPIFSASSLPEFIELWEELEKDYQPNNASQSFRILATIQASHLATVRCKGQSASVYDVKGGRIQVKMPGQFGVYNPADDEVEWVGIHQK
jgi:hypothetical protein